MSSAAAAAAAAADAVVAFVVEPVSDKFPQTDAVLDAQETSATTESLLDLGGGGGGTAGGSLTVAILPLIADDVKLVKHNRWS